MKSWERTRFPHSLTRGQFGLEIIKHLSLVAEKYKCVLSDYALGITAIKISMYSHIKNIYVLAAAEKKIKLCNYHKDDDGKIGKK